MDVPFVIGMLYRACEREREYCHTSCGAADCHSVGLGLSAKRGSEWWPRKTAVGGVGTADRVVKGVNEFVHVSHISWPIWANCGVEKRHLMLLQLCIFSVQPKRRNIFHHVQHNVLEDSGLMWERQVIYDMIWYDMICLLTAIRLTPGGSSTVQYSTHLHTNSTQNNRMKQNTRQNIHNSKNT
jgi:hypothetical protein